MPEQNTENQNPQAQQQSAPAVEMPRQPAQSPQPPEQALVVPNVGQVPEYKDPAPPPNTPKKKCGACKWMFAIGLLLILGAVGYYLYQQYIASNATPPTPVVTKETPETLETTEATETTTTSDLKKDTGTVTDELIEEIDALDSMDIDTDYSSDTLNDLEE